MIMKYIYVHCGGNSEILNKSLLKRITEILEAEN